jgi:hypothetical protein
MKKHNYIIGVIFATFALTSCQSMTSGGKHSAVCKEMEHELMFNGETMNPSQAFTERSEQGKLAQSYHDEGCT